MHGFVVRTAVPFRAPGNNPEYAQERKKIPFRCPRQPALALESLIASAFLALAVAYSLSYSLIRISLPAWNPNDSYSLRPCELACRITKSTSLALHHWSAASTNQRANPL